MRTRVIPFYVVLLAVGCSPRPRECDAQRPCEAAAVCVVLPGDSIGLCVASSANDSGAQSGAGGQTGDADAGCPMACAEYERCVGSSCEAGRLTVVSPTEGQTFLAGTAVPIQASLETADGQSWPRPIQIPLTSSWGPESLVLSGQAGMYRGADTAGVLPLTLGWANGPRVVRNLVFEACSVNCRPVIESCRPTADGGVCTRIDGVCSPGDTCRPAAGQCDVAEMCQSDGGCPADVFAPTTQRCGVTPSQPCDVAEFCTGTSATCPADRFADAGTVCLASNGECDTADICTGSGPSCPQRFVNAGVVCRMAAGDCDVAESCTGSSPACPANVFVAAGARICRPSVEACEDDAYCSGIEAACPANPFRPPTYQCRAAAPICDVAENCTGFSAACPPDLAAPTTTLCRLAQDDCDVEDYCDGVNKSCSDRVKTAGMQCRNARGACDRIDFCDGTSKACIDSTRVGEVCALSSAACEQDAVCVMGNDSCPAKMPRSNTYLCRGWAGPCDRGEYCDGNSRDCPADGFEPSTRSCRALTECREAAFCSGSSVSCGNGAPRNNGAMCNPGPDCNSPRPTTACLPERFWECQPTGRCQTGECRSQWTCVF
jgi:hypothetical protein